MGFLLPLLFTVKVRKPRVLLSLSKEFSRVSEMSCLHLHVADSSVLASSPLGTHEMGSSVLLQVFL